MEKLRTKEPKTNRKGCMAVCAAIGGGAILLAGCSNLSGEGNEFKVEGRVVSVGDRSVTVETVRVDEAHGDAKGWFDDGKKHQVHNNYKDNWCDMKTVGHEFTAAGVPESLDDLQTGELVELDGKIRDSYTYCGKYAHYQERPVFDKLTEIS